MSSSVSEGSPADAMIYLTGSVSGDVTVSWETVAGTATPGSDYTHASGTLQLSEMMYMEYVYVSTLTDSTYDPGETFSIVLTGVTGDAMLGSPSSAQITIDDTGSPGGGGGSQPTSVMLTSPGTLNEGQGFDLQGYVSPPGSYWIEGTVDWGDSPGMGSETFSTYTMSDGSFWLPFQYYDDGASPGNGTPSDVETIEVHITSAGSLSGTTTATVNNIAPTGSGFDLSTYMPLGGPNWQLEGYIHDLNPGGDLLTVTIDWGDGSNPTVLEDLPPDSFVYQNHTYPPDGRTYSVQVTVEDDDTGQWLWSKALEMYLLDLDNDADNNDVINEDDDPIETNYPGKYVRVNNDIDIEGEDDLVPFNLAFVPVSRPEANDYIGWHVALLAPAGAGIWESPDRTGEVIFSEETPYGSAKVWEVGTVAIPPTLYFEGLVSGFIPLELRLFDPWWFPVDVDAILFGVADPRVNMDIGHGISHQYVGRARHAITVANINDTDGDGVVDINDNSVTNTIQGESYEELDLMPLKILKPVPYDPAAALTLTVVKGEVKFWTAKTKEDELDAGEIATLINSWDAEETEKEIWVEAREISEEPKSIHLELKYMGASADVFATAVWAEMQRAEHDYHTPNEVFNLFSNLKTDLRHSGVKSEVENARGTGLIPPFAGHTYNGIVMEYYVYPLGIANYRHSITFDVTRRMDLDQKGFDAAGGAVEAWTKQFGFPTMHPDAANDDPNNSAESSRPDDASLFYSMDAPGYWISAFETVDKVVTRYLAEEYIRVNIKLMADESDYPERPSGGTEESPKVSGSRASDMYKWSARHNLKNEGGKLTRIGGDDPETATNNIREGHQP